MTASGGIVAAGVALSSKTHVLGVAGAANVVFTAVSGSQAAYVLIWKDTGTDGTSPLIALYDTATGLPVTPNGGDITVAWSGGNLFTLFQGLPEGAGVKQRLWEWLRGVLGIPARMGPGGLWLPEPQIALA